MVSSAETQCYIVGNGNQQIRGITRKCEWLSVLKVITANETTETLLPSLYIRKNKY